MIVNMKFRSSWGWIWDWIAIADLKDRNFSYSDVLIGITASGRTPYVLGALNYSKSISALTISISSVPERD